MTCQPCQQWKIRGPVISSASLSHEQQTLLLHVKSNIKGTHLQIAMDLSVQPCYKLAPKNKTVELFLCRKLSGLKSSNTSVKIHLLHTQNTHFKDLGTALASFKI